MTDPRQIAYAEHRRQWAEENNPQTFKVKGADWNAYKGERRVEIDEEDKERSE